MKPQSTIILEGGLGNRMRVAAAAHAMARRTQLPLRVLWLKQWGMRCRYDDLFDSPDPAAANFELRDARRAEPLCFARPTLRNLYLPAAAQRLRFRRRIDADSVIPLAQQGFDFEAWLRAAPGLLAAYRDFCPWQSDDLQRLFRPNAATSGIIGALTQAFTPATIGVHIRRADHQVATDASPLNLFTDAIDAAIARQPATNIFLATDDEPTKHTLRQRYGRRIICSDSAATRDNPDGLRHALAEMVALSRTVHIYGSAASTFSQVAAALGGKPIDILTRQGRAPLNILCTPSP